MSSLANLSGAAGALTLAVGFASAAQAATETHFVGTVTDDLFIGVALAGSPDAEGTHALAIYLCDGAGVSRWVFGTAEGDEATFEADDLRVALDLSGDAPAGAVTLAGGDPADFDLDAATGDAGVYRPVQYAGGWIILNNEEQRGAIAFRDQMIHPPLDPAEGVASVNGEAIVAQPDLGLADCFPEASGRCPL